jgi:hypothetical protein
MIIVTCLLKAWKKSGKNDRVRTHQTSALAGITIFGSIRLGFARNWDSDILYLGPRLTQMTPLNDELSFSDMSNPPRINRSLTVLEAQSKSGNGLARRIGFSNNSDSTV